MPMPRLVLTTVLLAPLLAAAAGPARIGGVYESNWDEVRLTQDGDRVRGTYVCCGGGTIEGRIIEGRIVRYRWTQPGGSGMGVWRIDGNQLRGTWGWGRDDDDGGRWDLSTSQQVAR
jgi:hypothetical protein